MGWKHDRPRLEPYLCRTPTFANARKAWTERKGLMLALPESWGGGVGEASPLPGYSPDTLDRVESALEGWRPDPQVLGRLVDVFHCEDDPPGGLAEALAAVDCLVSELPVDLPAAGFAVETALLGPVGRRFGRTACEVFAVAAGLPTVEPPGLAPGTAPEPQVLTAPLLDLGGSLDPLTLEEEGPPAVVKIKVGRKGEARRELAFIDRLRAQAPELEIRLDANGAWSRSQAAELLPRLAALDVRWIEEPWTPRTLAELRSMIDHSPVPVALDESLWRLRLGTFAGAPAFGPDALQRSMPAALVLKPQLLGGVLPCLRTALAWPETPSIVSHAFDGPVAYGACLALARTLDRRSGLGPQYHGLAIHDVLRHWSGPTQRLVESTW